MLYEVITRPASEALAPLIGPDGVGLPALGTFHPLQETLTALHVDLLHHMQKEDQILFPAIADVEAGRVITSYSIHYTRLYEYPWPCSGSWPCDSERPAP